MIRKYFFLFLFLVFFAGCKTLQPTPPAATYSPFVFKPELSQVNVPVQIPASKIETSINHQLTGILYEDATLSDDDMAMKVWKRENILFTVVGEEFRYKVPLKVWLKAGFKVEKFGVSLSDYEETEFTLNVNLVTKVSIDENWKVSTHTSLSNYEWINKPSLDYGLVKIPLTYIADKIIESQKDKLAGLIDEQAKKYLDIKPYMEDAWKQIQAPIVLSEDPASWLKITPVEVQMSPLMGRAGEIQSTIGIKAYSQVHLGTKPETKITPLPKLKLTRDETGSFSIFLVSDIYYDYAEKLAKKYIEGTEYTFKDGKKKVRIDNINLYGSSNRIIIQMGISGNVKGTIYLNGIPYYDAASQSIKVKDVDFDVDTKSKLIKSADWLAHGVFLKKVEPYLSFSLKEELSESKKLIEQGLTNNKITKNITLDGRLTQLNPQDIYLTEESMKAVILIKGIMEVDIEGLE